MHMQLQYIKPNGSEFDVVIMPIAQASPILLTRNLLYTGMTRAKKNLHLFSVRQLNHKDAEISRFIKEAQPPEKKN